MKAILLTQNQATFVDDQDFHSLSERLWYAAKVKAGTFYAQTRVAASIIQMQRVICAATEDEWVDHWNHDTLDNRRENLRKCTPCENARNQSANRGGSSEFKGVCWHRKIQKWQAFIGAYPKEHLGYFDSEQTAAEAYDARAIVKFGVFAFTNFGNKNASTISELDKRNAMSSATPRVFIHWRHALNPSSRFAHTTRFFYFGGKTLTVSQWAVDSGIKLVTLRNRIYGKRWGIERAVTTPVRQ